MDKEYKKAPEIFTCKDLDYLKDMFGWNHTAFKLMNDCVNFVEDDKVNKVISDCIEMFDDNMQRILTILKEGNNNE